MYVYIYICYLCYVYVYLVDLVTDSFVLLNPTSDTSVRNNIFCRYEVKDLIQADRKDLLAIYAYFDPDNNDLLEGVEIRMLAIEIIERTFFFLAEEMIDKDPTLNHSRKRLNNQVLQEAYFYLPGECESDKDKIRDMVRFIATALDPAGNPFNTPLNNPLNNPVTPML